MDFQHPSSHGRPQRQSDPATRAAPSSRRIRSQDLMGAASEIEIVHGPDVYRLRRTALGKLILTK